MVDNVMMSNQNIPYASEPPKFSGEEEPLAVAAFLTRMSIHLRRFKFPDDYNKILYFAHCLTEEAALWFAGLTEESLRQGTFSDFMKRFEREYYNELQIDSILTQLRFYTQEGSLQAYNEKFDALAAAIPDTLLSPACKLSFYLSGLKTPLQITVSNLEPDSLETAMILASRSCRKERIHGATYSRKDHPAEGNTQMEIDAIRTGYKRARTDSSDTHKLTEEERRVLKKYGICFRCRAGKHMANKCPMAN
ncbi:hypothetical protein HG537_0E06010 [Torulaspora globosa]|uniref:Ty3 transposon capsid-like protein domain-containing protein n=1 Tax=Torulaspora globosa TaxID=48254 RepID=A0A7H9HU24_9SACH|nr:hypothetical protein HG537_0E06010 [Torulaspora sp. CBS 2947]